MGYSQIDSGGKYLSARERSQWRQQRAYLRRMRRFRRLIALAGLPLTNGLLISMADSGYIDPRFAIGFAAVLSVFFTWQIK